MAVLEVGVGSLLGVVEQLDVGAAPRDFVSAEGSSEGWLLNLCSSVPCLHLSIAGMALSLQWW
jgi:hypothetical protein